MCNNKNPLKSILIEAEADGNIANNEGRDPIMCFVQKGDGQIMTELIKAEADVNITKQPLNHQSEVVSNRAQINK